MGRLNEAKVSLHILACCFATLARACEGSHFLSSTRKVKHKMQVTEILIGYVKALMDKATELRLCWTEVTPH